MIESSGKNNFNGKFDSFEWNAPYYETPKEVMKVLKEIHFEGKVIKDIKVIGHVCGVGESDNERYIIEKIEDAGIELPDKWWETYPFLDKIRVPWEVKACEPFQIIFEDNTTLEIQPMDNGGARIASNSIPIEIKDGLNYSNFNANLFFKEAIGLKLERIDFKTKTTTIKHYFSHFYQPKESTSCFYQLCINLEKSSSFDISFTRKGWYEICFCCPGDEVIKMLLGRAIESVFRNDKITIINGRKWGGYFWIYPLCSKSGIIPECCDNLGMTIDFVSVSEFLTEFLHKYFDINIQDSPELRFRMSYDENDVNLYSIQSIRNMIQDIKKTIELLRENPDDESLIKILSNFPRYYYSKEKGQLPLSPARRKVMLKKYIPIAIDFYERFTKRLESMISLPGIDTVSFEGP